MNNYNSVYTKSIYTEYFTYENIQRVVQNGTYAMIESVSSQANNVTELDENVKFNVLGHFLTFYQFPHRQITGSYEGMITEFSFFVIKPENVDLKIFRETIFDLGQKFKQESVILSSKGIVDLTFTTGENTGKFLKGEGYNSTIGKNYSEIKTTDEKSYFIGEYNIDRETFLDWIP